MTVRLKPNGSAKIIMDMSWPHHPPEENFCLGSGKLLSPNQGMRDWLEFETCTVTIHKAWTLALYRNGQRALMCKSDWDFAYKHISVAEMNISLASTGNQQERLSHHSWVVV